VRAEPKIAAARARWRVVAVACALAVLGAGCARPAVAGASAARHAPLPSAPAAGGTAPALDYTFRVSEALDALHVRVCFHGAPPAELVAGVPNAPTALQGAWVETPRGRQPLPVDRDRISLALVPAGGCMRYAVDLSAERSGFASARMEHGGDALVTNTALWLWRPRAYREAGAYSARIIMPEGMRASVPWQSEGPCPRAERCERYVLDASALAFYAFAVFGRFETEHITLSGATIELAVLSGLPPQTRAGVVPWLETAARAASLPFGRFPRKRAQVVVIPAPASTEPVRFGMMNRGGGASAAMRLPVNAEIDALQHDWVALHEFCHLLHPFVAHEDAWLPEGLATYFQEVLRARAGMQPEATAWRRLLDGARLGRGVEGSLAQESAGMFGPRGYGTSASFRTVYWGGAAFALIADVEVRRQTHGRLSLEAVLRELSGYFRSQPRAFSAAEVMERMDAVVGQPLFLPLMKRWVEAPELPQLDALYAQLGVRVESDGVRFADDAQDAWIRSAIMQPAAGAGSLVTASAQP
jgi:hypothetical protein